jgi:hypothetical protein
MLGRIAIAAVVFAAISLMGCCSEGGHPSSPASPAGEVARDSQITRTIEQTLARNERTANLYIKVQTEGGIVRLTGVAHSPAERQTAEDVAKSTNGVRGVVNQIALELPSLSLPDTSVHGDYRRAMPSEPINANKPGGPRRK